MFKTNTIRTRLLLFLPGALAGCASIPPAGGGQAPPAEFRRRFLLFCDLAVKEFRKEITPFPVHDREYADPATHHMPAFEDAHAVRALAVAYDMTGERKYLDACRRWADHTLRCQSRMIPAGAYYMNHSRAPGEDHGQWNVADSGTIAMGVLATAVRCTDPAEKGRYLESTKAFAKLVMDNYVSREGGVSNGLWPEYAGPWWCSSATFGTFAFQLYDETHEEKYLKVAMGALEWLLGQDFREVRPITFEQRPSGIIFYCFDFYVHGLKHLSKGTPLYDRATEQIDLAVDWMAKNQKTRGANVPDYTQKNVDMAAMPYLMYSFARLLPRHRDLVPIADRELRYIGDLLCGAQACGAQSLRDCTRPQEYTRPQRGRTPQECRPNVSRLMIWEVMTWGMLSYAERLAPGALSRSSHDPVSRPFGAED
ncbi:MAG TPA: hypothetical protein PLC79_06415 [Phycisphaerae bacterium]|nr:hypothetical protein [Phycisphaerae bacterium]